MTRAPSIVIARDMLARGFEPVPMLPRAKRERRPEWRAITVTADNVEDQFDDPELNIAIKLGREWGNLVDVDIDNDLVTPFAERLLPPTGLIWGRTGRPRTHRVYRLTDAEPCRRWMSVLRRCLMELRSDTQCVNVPGSVHPSGQIVEYQADGEPALVDRDEFMAAMTELARAVRVSIGEGPDGGVPHVGPIGGNYHPPISSAGGLP